MKRSDRGPATPGGWSWRVLARLDAWSNRVYGSRYNPLYHSGALVVALFGVLLVTGLYLLLFYRIGAPWASVGRITDQVWMGRWIRGVHRFASDAVVVAAVAHAFRMYAQRRRWGPRALAWISGVVLLGVIFICGWTGYVLVWDVQAQLLAVEGARLLDMLPLFAEPIGRTFVGEEPLPNAFFFLNLFAHIALPIGVGLLVWIHVSRVARPKLLPPRGVIWGVVGALTLLAVVWPLEHAPEADLFRIPSGVPLDLFYGFWLPWSRRLPAWVVWMLGGGLVGVVALVPFWTRPRAERRPAKSLVHERHCTGCEQCMHDCPYDAITMVPRSDGREGQVALVDQSACVSCGICIGSCAPMAVGLEGWTGRDQLTVARAFIAEHQPNAGDVVVIGCVWSGASAGWFAGDVHAGMTAEITTRRPRAHLFPVDCAGSLHTSTIEHLLRHGAGGVLIVSCPVEDCRGREGGKWLVERVLHGREAELRDRVDRRKVRLLEAGARDLMRVDAALAEFSATITDLAGPDGDRGRSGAGWERADGYEEYSGEVSADRLEGGPE